MENSTILRIVRKGWFFFGVAFLLVYILAIAVETTSVFAAGPWKGRIIDMETKEPLEGAVVLAVWMRAYRTPAGDNTYFYEAKEVLTDKEGRFEIPSYRPINLLPIISYMRGPRFIVFKPGYLSIEISLTENVTDKAVELPEKGKVFRLSPGIIELPKLMTREERRMVGASPMGDKKDWKKQKQFIKLLREEWEYLTGKPAGDLYKIEEDN